MHSEQLTAKQMLIWSTSAMSAPLAIYASKTSWDWVLLTGILCIGAVLLVLRFGTVDYGVICRLLQLIPLSVTAGVFAREISPCWGEESAYMPLVLLALAALSATDSSPKAGRVCCCIAWIIAILYTLILSVGIKNIHWTRIEQSGNYNTMLIISYLIPLVWLMIPSVRSKSVYVSGMVLFGTVISLLCLGTLSAKGVSDAQLPIYQYSKSLTMLGVAERFEAATSVVLTLGLFCTLSLLLSAAEQMIKHGAILAAVIGGINVSINPVFIVIYWVFAWIMLPLSNAAKKVKKR